MFTEADLLPISALQHLLFCERQCALIHVERIWVENRLTIEGRHLHDKAHDGPDETRKGARIVRGLALRSLRLGLSGVADVVEFSLVKPPDGGGHDRIAPAKRSLRTLDGQRSTQQEGFPAELTSPEQAVGKMHAPAATSMIALPVEYKRGKPKRDDSDRVQLCAQALCLEEMLDIAIPRGALYYGRPRRRQEVLIDDDLRSTTAQAATRLHELIASGKTPVAQREPKCNRCSLLKMCMPDAIGPSRSASRYLARILRAAATE